MEIKVKPLSHFSRRLKQLHKKYSTLIKEMEAVGESLKKNPKQGTDLGAGFHKMRVASASKVGGKSGGFRVLTYFVEQTAEGDVVYLVTIFDKSERANITKSELLKIVKDELG